jgi:hypothetical protein
VIPEYVAYLAAQRSEETFIRYALADTPLEPGGDVPPPADRFGWLRAGISADLCRLAEWLHPGLQPRPYVVEKA